LPWLSYLQSVTYVTAPFFIIKQTAELRKFCC
jgi:hypothetical protein